MTAPESIKQLVEQFERDLESYRSAAYKEAQLRQEFLNPFFEALGWDMSNRSRKSFDDREVIHEDAMKIEDETKAPDYAFKVGRERKFFVEAKKPAVNIETSIDPAYQLRSYAWSATLPLSILTDFEEFSVYDCRFEPEYGDKASVARVMLISFRDYLERWDEIASIFSREAVGNGSFDKYAEAVKSKKGTIRIDEAILAEIEKWRDLLARNIAVREPDLSVSQLNYAVQATIDRIIFLRICEDRKIEPYGQLRTIGEEKNIYAGLTQLFQKADAKYNSGLFHFRDEKEQSSYPDSFTLNLKIDDKVLKEILTNLYFPKSSYKFKEIPVEILGKIYEQFLGKVIRLTPSHQAKVEVKPEVKKAGGVFYTPTFIVSYIVINTLGKLLMGLTPKEAAKLRIIDPACGSGTFLLGAYQYLLDWHLNWYLNNDPEKWAAGKKPALYALASKDGYRLTGAKKKEILLNNIYGVDIDAQAVEVTKLSLLLKVLEDESAETIGSQLALFQERVLPDLGKNIKCGNSLIAPDYWEGRFEGELGIGNSEEERAMVNAFDWKAAFPEVFAQGGFDSVIGNPPYGFHQIHLDILKPYFKNKFSSAFGSYENYFLFYEQSLSLLKNKGVHGFIVPITWLSIPSAKALREYILKNYHIQEILWLSDQVFENAQVNTLIAITKKEIPSETLVKICGTSGNSIKVKEERIYQQQKFIESDYYIGIFETADDTLLLQRILQISQPLKNFARPCSGYNPYEVGKGQAPNGGLQTKETVKTKPYHSTKKVGSEWKPEIVGRDLGRYSIHATGQRWIKYGSWLAAARDATNFLGKRLLIQEITGGQERRIIATYYEDELYYSRDVIPVKFDVTDINPFYVLGIVNSKLITWYHHRRNPKAQKALFPKVLVSDLANIPIRPINFTDPADKARHDKMVSLVERMLELHKRNPRTPQEKESLAGEIASVDRSIDELVYQLYGLTEDEVKIVEGR